VGTRGDVRRQRHLADVELEPADHAAKRVDERVDFDELELGGLRLHRAVLQGLHVALRADDGLQQHEQVTPSERARAAFMNAGGISSSSTSSTRLKTVKWSRMRSPVQKDTAVWSGGCPG